MIFSLRLITSALAACACLQLSSAMAQGFPNPGKPIRIVVPFPPGGTSDIHARQVASKLGPGSGRIRDRREQARRLDHHRRDGGGQGRTGRSHFALHAFADCCVNPHLFSKLPYDPIRDFTPITYACNGPTVLAVSTSLPANNVRELIEHARKNPGKLNFGSWSPGGTGQLNGELLKEFAGIDIVHVPYKGSADLVQALASGQVQMAFDGLFTARTLEKAGKVKIVAIADDKRAVAAPGVPTMAEAGAPGAYVSGGYHFFGPANLPRAIVARLNAELVKVLRMQDVDEMYTSTGMEVVASTPEEQVVILRTQSERQGSIIRKLGIKLD